MRCIRNLIFVSSLIFISAATGFAQAPSPPPPSSKGVPPLMRPIEPWKEFKNEAGNFVVTMPGKPLEMSQTIETEIGKVPTYSFLAQQGIISYIFMYADYPVAFDTPEAIKIGLNGSRDMLLN